MAQVMASAMTSSNVVAGRLTAGQRSASTSRPIVQNLIRGSRFGPQQRRDSGRASACRPQGFSSGQGWRRYGGMGAPGLGWNVSPQDLQAFMQDLDKMFGGNNMFGGDNMFGGAGAGSSSAADMAPYPIAVDVEKAPDAYTFTADLPGVNRQDAKVQANKDTRVLTISGERVAPAEADDGQKRRRRTERRFGKFHRTFKLPDDADISNIKAAFNNGVLTVTINRLEQPENVENVPIDDWLNNTTDV